MMIPNSDTKPATNRTKLRHASLNASTMMFCPGAGLTSGARSCTVTVRVLIATRVRR